MFEFTSRGNAYGIDPGSLLRRDFKGRCRHATPNVPPPPVETTSQGQRITFPDQGLRNRLGRVLKRKMGGFVCLGRGAGRSRPSSWIPSRSFFASSAGERRK